MSKHPEVSSHLLVHLGDAAPRVPLSLDLLKSNCHPTTPKLEICPKPVGMLIGVYHEGGSTFRAIAVNLPCNSWKCPFCNKKKKKELKRRLYKGGITEFVERRGFRNSKFAFKMLTLTCPGTEYRSHRKPEDALAEMNTSLHKLIRAIKKKWGKFHYLKIVEPHKADLFPHFHVLVVGHAIGPKEVLNQIRALWCGKYGMGNVDIQVLRKGLGAGINYITKYLTKDLKPIAKYKRIFTASQGALEPKKQMDWENKKFFLGCTVGKEESETIEIDPFAPEWLQKWTLDGFVLKRMHGIDAPF